MSDLIKKYQSPSGHIERRDNTYVHNSLPLQDFIKHSKIEGNGLTDFIPFVGDGLQAAEAVEQMLKGLYAPALLTAGLITLPNIVEKPLRMVSNKLLKGLGKRRLFSVAEYGADPIYTKEWVEQHPIELKLDRTGKGTSGNANNGKYDVTHMNMNVDGDMVGTGRQAIEYMNKLFDAAPHGQVLSFTDNAPLSLDSYDLVLNYLSKMEKEGKGMFIATKEAGPIQINKAATVRKSAAETNKGVSKVNTKYNKNFKPIEEKSTWDLNQKLMMEKFPWLQKTLKPITKRYGQSVQFIKFKDGGNI